MSAKKPVRRRRRPPVALDPATARRAAATLVARIPSRAERWKAERHREISAWWAKVVEEEKAAYLKETGQPMPMGAEELHAAAVAEGRAHGLPAASETVAQYTAADVHAMQRQRLEERRRQAEENVRAMAAADPATLVDRYQRAADSMSTISKKILRVMLNNNATSSGDKITRAQIAEWIGVDDGMVKRRIEGEIRRTESEFAFTMIDAVQAGGSWLTPEGVEVARRVSPKILT